MTFTASLLLDIVILVLLVSFVILGYRRGFILTLCSLLAAIIGLIGGLYLSDQYAAVVLEAMGGPLAPAPLIPLVPILLFLAGFLGAQVLWSLLCHALHLVAKLPVLHFLNKALGGLLGLAQGGIILAVVLWLLCVPLGWVPTEVTDQSLVFQYLSGLDFQLPLSW